MSIKHINKTSQPVKSSGYREFNSNNARNLSLSHDLTADKSVNIVNNYITAGRRAYKIELAADNKANNYGLEVVKSIFAARLYLAAFDKKMDDKKFKEYIIRQLFQVKGSVRDCPQKSTIYGKLKLVADLINLFGKQCPKLVGSDIAAVIDEFTAAVFANFSGLRDAYKQIKEAKDAMKPKKELTPCPDDIADEAPEVDSDSEVDSESDSEEEPTTIDPETQLMRAAAAFIEASEEFIAKYGKTSYLENIEDVTDLIYNCYRTTGKIEEMPAAV